MLMEGTLLQQPKHPQHIKKHNFVQVFFLLIFGNLINKIRISMDGLLFRGQTASNSPSPRTPCMQWPTVSAQPTHAYTRSPARHKQHMVHNNIYILAAAVFHSSLPNDFQNCQQRKSILNCYIGNNVEKKGNHRSREINIEQNHIKFACFVALKGCPTIIFRLVVFFSRFVPLDLPHSRHSPAL